MTSKVSTNASIFVRNLPYGVTQEELEQIFSDIGPIKKVDVIKDKGKRKNDSMTRGFAFIKFAIENDAHLAIEKLNETLFQGRKMRIDLAKDKGSKRQQMSASNTSTIQETAVNTDNINAKEEQAIESSSMEYKEKEKNGKKRKRTETNDESEQSGAIKDQEQVVDKNVKDVHNKRQFKDRKPEVQPIATSNAVDSKLIKKQKTEGEHIQSERNARRREHRKLLRTIAENKEKNASVNDKTIIIYGLGPEITMKVLQKKLKKIAPTENIQLQPETKTAKQFATVVLQKLVDVDIAIRKLDEHIFKGHKMKVVRANAGSDGKLMDKKSDGVRLIVRNLHYDAMDKDLEDAFQEFGPLAEAHVVRMPVEDNNDPNAIGRSRGFGFVEYYDPEHATNAVEKMNAVKLKGREIVVDIALSKLQYLKQQKESAVIQDEKTTELTTDEELGEEVADGEQDDATFSDNSDSDGNATSDEEDEDHNNEEDDEGNKEESDSEDKDELEDQPNRVEKPKEDTDSQRYRTIFIRNLSFETTEESLASFFKAYGAIDYARICYDHSSGLSKGVAFVRFKDADVADRVLALGRTEVNDPKMKKSKNLSSKKITQLSVTLSALADGNGLMLDNRVLSLTRAVKKDDAERLAGANAMERKKKDKRNMYLAYEGTINVNKQSDEDLQLPKSDIEKRRRAIREKKEKLKNPMYFVSPTRLSVRNISSSVDDKQLKDLFQRGAIVGMKKSVVSLSTDIKEEYLPKNPNQPISERTVKVKMAKIVRDKEGKQRSKGYGFVEFHEHIHALAALRVLNNNPMFTQYAAGKGSGKIDLDGIDDIESKEVTRKFSRIPDNEKSRLIVEFALENHGKLKLREKRRADAMKKREEEMALKEATPDPTDANDKPRKSRGQRQRERKQQRAQEKEQFLKPDSIEKISKKSVIKPQQMDSKRKRVMKDPSSSDFQEERMLQSATKEMFDENSRASKKQKKQRREEEANKSFDALVNSYKAEIFGSNNSSTKAKKANNEVRERWFD